VAHTIMTDCHRRRRRQAWSPQTSLQALEKGAMVEKRQLGGSVRSTGACEQDAHQGSQYGSSCTRATGEDGHGNGASVFREMGRGVMERVRSVRQKVYEGERPEVFEKRGINVHFGDATFVDTTR